MAIIFLNNQTIQGTLTASGIITALSGNSTQWNTAYTDRNKWDGGSTGLTASTGRGSLGGTTIGQNIFTLTNPGAITFPRFNAANTVSALSAADFRTAIGAGTSSTTGTVTSVGISHAGDAFTTSAAITTTGTLAITMAGTAAQYINGQGNLITFPSSSATNLAYTTAATTGVVTSSTGTNATLPAATTTLAGLLTGADKTKLDGIATGAQVNVATNLTKTTSVTDVTINSSTGSNIAIGAATTSVAGVMTKALYDNVIANNAKVSNVTSNLGYTASTTNGVVTSSDGTNATLPLVVAAGNAGLMTGGDKSKLNGIADGANNITYAAGSGLSLTNTTFANTAPNIVQTTVSGNAGSATVLQTARTIAGVSFNGSANISLNNNAITNGAGYITSTSGTSKGANQNYVASSTSTSNRGNYGSGVWAYSGFSTGSNRPFTYDATLQVMPTSGMGFELSVDWLSQTGTPLKIRSLRDCCQGWSDWTTVWTSTTDGSGSGLDADLLDGQQGSYYYPASNPANYTGNQDLSGYVTLATAQTISGAKTFNNDIVLNTTNLTGVDQLSTDTITIASIANATIDTDKFLVSDNGLVRYRTGAEVRSDIGAGTGSGSVTSVNNGNGMNFTNITATGTVTLGTPSTITATTTNSVSASSHTHAITGFATGTGSASGVNTGDQTNISGNAATATNANNATNSSILNSGATSDLNTTANSVSAGQLIHNNFSSSASNRPPASDNANSVITVGQHSGNYNAQLAFSSDGSMYWRDNPSTSFGSWRTVWDSGNDGSGSGLDADLLDGQQGSYYYPASNPANFTSTQTTVSGNAGTATTLQTARTIAGVSFNGSANISLNNNAITNGAGYITSYVNTTYTAGSGITLTGTVFSNASPNVTTNLSTSTSATTLTVNSSDGSNAILPAATTTVAGVLTGADKAKLNGIATSATNVTNNNQITNGAGYITSYVNTTYTAGSNLSLTGTVFANTAPNIVQTTVSGNAGTATTLQTARTIAGVSFNGSANISLNNNAITNGAGYITSYVNTTYSAGSGLSLTGTVFANTAPNIVQTTVSGNAGTATTLQTARTINGVSFNGSGDITVEPYVEDAVSTSVTRYITFVDDSTAGYKRLNEDANLSYNPGTNILNVPGVTATTDVRSPRFYDSNNTAYYLDPASTSYVNDIRATIYYDRANTAYFVRPSVTSIFNDARASIFYSRSNTSYYTDPESTSNLYALTVNAGNLNMYENGTYSSELTFQNNTHKLGIDYQSDETVRFITRSGTTTVPITFQMRAGTITAGNFILSSDKRLKTKIKELSTENIKVRWKSFEMKNNEGEYRAGVIAQELEENHPEFVNTDEKGFKSVKYIDLLIAKIAELEARLEKAGI